jgi:hypothetical protein
MGTEPRVESRVDLHNYRPANKVKPKVIARFADMTSIGHQTARLHDRINGLCSFSRSLSPPPKNQATSGQQNQETSQAELRPTAMGFHWGCHSNQLNGFCLTGAITATAPEVAGESPASIDPVANDRSFRLDKAVVGTGSLGLYPLQLRSHHHFLHIVRGVLAQRRHRPVQVNAPRRHRSRELAAERLSLAEIDVDAAAMCWKRGQAFANETYLFVDRDAVVSATFQLLQRRL